MSKWFAIDLFNRFNNNVAGWSFYTLYPDHDEALILAIRSGEAFDTGWFSTRMDETRGRVLRTQDNHYTCMAWATSMYGGEGFGEISFQAELSAHPQRIAVEIKKQLSNAHLEALKAKRQSSNVEVFLIGRYTAGHDDHAILSKYIVPNPRVKKPYTQNWEWGFQDEIDLPAEVVEYIQTACKEFVEDPEGHLSETREPGKKQWFYTDEGGKEHEFKHGKYTYTLFSRGLAT